MSDVTMESIVKSKTRPLASNRSVRTPRRGERSLPSFAPFVVLLVLLAVLAVLSACGSPPEGSPTGTDDTPAPAAESDAKPVATAEPAAKGAEEEVAVIDTNHGTMVFRFFPEAAPKTVAHVKALIEEGFYDGKTFYRVVAGHVIQGGAGFDYEDGPMVEGEFGAYPHVVGAVGLARDEDPDSGSTEIYICLDRRAHLDGSYATFGLLTEGYDVLEAIGALEVEEQWEGEVAFHRPLEPVVIESLRLEKRPVPPLVPADEALAAIEDKRATSPPEE